MAKPEKNQAAWDANKVRELCVALVNEINLAPGDALYNGEHITQIFKKCSLPGAYAKISGVGRGKANTTVDYSKPVKV